MKKLQTAQSHVYTVMDKLGPVKEALVSKDDDWEEWDLEQLVENLRKYVDRHPVTAESSLQASRKSAVPKGDFKGSDRMMLASASGHVASKCRSRGCIKGGRRYHTSVCDSSSPSGGEQASGSASYLANEKGKRAMEETTAIHATLMAKENGIDKRIMLDSGAGSSYICTNLIRQLNIRPFKTERRAIEQMNGMVVKQAELYGVTVASNAVEGFTMDLKCINGEKDV